MWYLLRFLGSNEHCACYKFFTLANVLHFYDIPGAFGSSLRGSLIRSPSCDGHDEGARKGDR